MAHPKTKKALEIMGRIESAKRLIATYEAELDALFEVEMEKRTASVGIPRQEESPTESGANSASLSIPQKVLRMMRAKPEHTFTAADFKSLLGETKLENIRSTLIRLAAREDIINVARGQYRLPPTQISLPTVSAGSK